MGNLVDWLKSRGENENVMLDFENAMPTEGQLDIYDQVTGVLEKGPPLLQLLDEFKPSSDEIRLALGKPTPANEETAFVSVRRNADIIYQFYKFAKELEKCIPLLLLELSSADPSPLEEKKSMALSLRDRQALAKLLADVFDFVLKFDEIKMMRPGLQNDFSYYRRALPKHMHQNLTVNDSEASFISMFIAAHIPMMTCLSNATSKLLAANPEVTIALATMATVCMNMVRKKMFDRDSTNLFCLRAMTGSIILVDHIDLHGAFHKKSPIDIKNCLSVLATSSLNTRPLINAIRFSTLHFSDESTPSALRNLLEE